MNVKMFTHLKSAEILGYNAIVGVGSQRLCSFNEEKYFAMKKVSKSDAFARWDVLCGGITVKHNIKMHHLCIFRGVLHSSDYLSFI